MRLVHISDTHLGFSAYNRIDSASGVNQRELDFYSAFTQGVYRIIELKPDLVVHSGDLFDTVRPQNRAIDVALRQLIRLSDAGIDVVLISGNHSTPRLSETGNIFRIFEHLRNVHPVHSPGVETIISGDTTVHAIPHSANPPMSAALSNIRMSSETKHNVLVLHAGIDGSSMFRMDEFNEQIVTPKMIPGDMDYVALGHYHRFSEVRKKMYYSGSTERSGFGEVGQRKGFVEVDLDRGQVEFHELKTREMIDLPSVDGKGLTATDIMANVRERAEADDLNGKIARLAINEVGADALRSLDLATMRRYGSDALHFELKIERADAAIHAGVESTTIGTLASEYRRFVESMNASDERRRRLLELGAHYFVEE
jgi:exonuclease SbcD